MASIITSVGPAQTVSKSSKNLYPFHNVKTDPFCYVSHLSPEWQKEFDMRTGINALVSMGPGGSLIRKYEEENGEFRKGKLWPIHHMHPI